MQLIEFNKNKNLFNDQLSTAIEFSSDTDPALLLALSQNKLVSEIPLPIVIGEGKVTATGNEKKFQFKNENELLIDGGAEAFLRVGLFSSKTDVTKDIQEKDKLSYKLDDLNEGEVYGLFSFGYSLNANAKGEWGLGSGSFSAGFDGSKSKRVAIITRIPKDTGLKDAIEATISELRLPKHINTHTDLEKGTNIIVQTSGAVKGSFGAQVGYDFNWVYESKNPELEGTVGLKAKLGAQLGVGFDIAGEYQLVINKSITSNEINLQLYKQRKKGWSFALSLAASIKADLDDFKETSLDDLTKATLGIHFTQILEDLDKVREYLDPEELKSKIDGITDDLLEKLADVGVGTAYEQIRTEIIKILDKWDELGEEAGATLWKLLDEKLEDTTSVDLDEIREVVNKIANDADTEVKEYLSKILSDIGYQNTPIGKVLNAILPSDDIIDAISNTSAISKIQDQAKAIANVLAIEEQVIKFHEVISERIKLDKIREAVEANDFDTLGDWLQGKLSDFIVDDLGEPVMDKLKEVDKFIQGIRDNHEKIFEKTKEALQKEYGVSIAFNYQKQKEETALINASFDLTKSRVTEVFKQALDGDFDQLLVDQIDGIKLSNGTLSYGIKKEKTLSLSLPFMQRDFNSINNSIATGKFIEEDDGRLIMYQLEAESVLRKSNRMSQMALEGFYKNKKSGDAVINKSEELGFAYSFRLARKRLPTKHLEQIVEPFIKRYLPEVFNNDTVTGKESTDGWITDMDNQIDRVNNNGQRNFGKTLLNLELRVPAELGAAWFDAPDDSKDETYEEVSDAIQNRLRQLVPLYFLENEDVFIKSNLKDELYTVMTYMSLPAITQFKFKNNGKLKWHWRYLKSGELKKWLNKTETKLALVKNLGQIKARLAGDPDPNIRKLADDYDTQTSKQMLEILNQAATSGTLVNMKLRGLFGIERKIISDTIAAGTRLAHFVDQSNASPKMALKGLQQFGSIITETFNKNSGISIIASRKDYTRYLGTELFLAVAEVFDPTLAGKVTGSLELLVLKDGSGFDTAKYLENELPNKDDLIISNRFLNLG